MGKPVVIEETFPLKCSTAEFEQFIDGSKKHAAGWIGFYWGKTAGGMPQVEHDPGRLHDWAGWSSSRKGLVRPREPRRHVDD